MGSVLIHSISKNVRRPVQKVYVETVVKLPLKKDIRKMKGRIDIETNTEKERRNISNSALVSGKAYGFFVLFVLASTFCTSFMLILSLRFSFL